LLFEKDQLNGNSSRLWKETLYELKKLYPHCPFPFPLDLLHLKGLAEKTDSAKEIAEVKR